MDAAKYGTGRRSAGLLAMAVVVTALGGLGAAGRAVPFAGPPDDGEAAFWPWCGGVADCPLRAGAADLGAEAGPGWVRRYAVAGPFAAQAVEARGVAAFEAELAATGLEKKGRPVFKWVTASDGRLEVAGAQKGGRGSRGETWVVATEVWSAAAREVRLLASVSGAASVHVGGVAATPVGGPESLERTEAFLADDAEVPVKLAAGWNRLVVALARRPEAPVAWRMRLRGLDGAPVGGLLWKTGEGVAADAGCGWLGPRLALRADVGAEVGAGAEAGFRVTATLAPAGIGPVGRPEVATLRRRSDGAELARAHVWDLLAAGASLEARLTRADEVVLALDGAACLTLAPPPKADARLSAVAAARRSLSALTRLDAASRDSLAVVVDELAGLLGRAVTAGAGGPNDKAPVERFEPLRGMLMERLAAAERGRDPFQAPGFHVRAYRSPIDGSMQRYVVAVPRNYLATKRLPLVVLSHGLNFHAEEMMLSALGERAAPRTEDARRSGVSFARGQLWREGPGALPDGMLLVSHVGYGEAGPRPVGRLEVLHVVEDVQRHWSVEPSRVSVTGFSLGGSVAFWAGLHHADVFAGAAPLCGYPNLEHYTNVRSVPKRPWEKQLVTLEGVSAHAPNGRQLPLWMVHGRRDSPSRSELIEDRYKALGYKARLDVPDEGHDIWDAAYADGAILRWLAGRRRNTRPAEVTLSAGRHRTAALDWLRIDRFARWGELGSLDGVVMPRGRVAGDPSGEVGTRLAATVRITTKGVAGFSLRVDRLPTGVGEGDALEVDGQALVMPSVKQDVHLGRGADGRWEVRAERVAAAKRTGVEGPLSEVYLSPYVVIVGTADPRQTEANWLVAERVATPSPAVRLAPRIVTDADWGDRPLAGTGAILIGGPRSNRVTARVAAGLAARGVVFEEGAIRVGGCLHAGEDVGVSLIVPNPEDGAVGPDGARSVGAYPIVVHAGVTAAGTLNARYLPELVPDIVVHDRRIRVAAGDKLLGPREVVWAGFFDEDWALMREDGACSSTR